MDWALYFEERVQNNTTWTATPIDAIVQQVGSNVYWQGQWTFDWRPAGLQSLRIASGTVRVFHLPDGTAPLTVVASIGDTHTSGGGSGATVSVSQNLSVLKVPPGTPTGVSATRVSDTQISVAWSQSSASNGQPETNDIVWQTNGVWDSQVSVLATNSATVSAAPNQKKQYQVRAWNSGAGFSNWSAFSNPVYTTPAAPTSVIATKKANLDVDITFVDKVAYAEHTHEVWHGTVSGGLTTWDSSPLATLPNGTTLYTHTAPDASKVHAYQVRARAGSLASAFVVSNTIQLLVAPGKPTVPAMPSAWDKAIDQTFSWVHNSLDTTPQAYYEYSRSIDGGATWVSGGKVASTVSQRVIAANSFPAGTALSMRVRTWGAATTGGSDGTGASPWSDPVTVTMKTAPTATITSPVNGSTTNDSTIRVTVGFSQPEGATFVKAQVQLLQGATLLETLDSNIQNGITFSTQAQNGVTYTIRARVQDSNGLWSAWVSSNVNVAYLAPVPAQVTATFLPETGYGQLDVAIPAPDGSHSAAVTLTITRKIDDSEESVVTNWPVSSALTFLDTVPTVNGINVYTITTTSALGATSVTTVNLVTTECRRAYLSKGSGFNSVVVFGGNLSVSESLEVASDTVSAAGRTKPIGLYGIETNVQLKVQSYLFESFGSSMDAVRALLLAPGEACYRDPDGRRVFGAVKGSISSKKVGRGDLSFTITETSR